MVGTATLAGMQAGDHVCVPFSGARVRTQIMEQFIRTGLDEGDKVICCTVADDPAAFTAALAAADPRVPGALRDGRLQIGSAADSYLATGRFDAERVAHDWRTVIGAAKREGHPGVRVIADMGWATGTVPGTERLAWYEAEVNRIFADGFARGVCLYDRGAFPPVRLRRYIGTHPGTVEPGDPQPPQLRMRHTAEPRGLALTGEADIANRAALIAVLDGLRSDLPGDDPLTVDLSGLTFADVAAAAALVRLTRRVSGLRLTGASRRMTGLLDLVRQADA
ncbi:MEDS domain-containing protein [Dactylosporangium sp. NPDC051541]|uniref:MEDS domain-containing protein n=1 Tax=Dactylosporangium sp. NPDC051541 TaxID=3363977 RepID=UPI0037BAD770